MIRIAARQRSLRSDDGFTLPELIVYSLLLFLVVGIIGGVLLSVTAAQRTVSSLTSVSNQAQVAVDSVTTNVRDASAFRLDAIGSDQVVQARVAKGTTSTVSWVCAAWYYSAANHTLRYHQSTSSLGTINAASAANWTLLASHVKPVSGTTIFSSSAPTLAISFKATGTNNAAAQMTTSVRVSATWTGDTCFTA